MLTQPGSSVLNPASATRCLALAVGAAVAGAGAVALAWRAGERLGDALATSPATATPDALVGGAATLVFGLLVGWLALCALLASAAALPGALGRAATDVARRVSPAAVRTAFAAALTVGAGLTQLTPALAAPTAAPTAAATSANDHSVGRAATSNPLPDPGWAPVAVDRSTAAPTWVPSRPPKPHRADDGSALFPNASVERAEPDDRVVVRRGDTLWAIAERHLPGRPTAAEIAHEWPRWHAANRSVIGPDPDRLRPGQRLRPPDSATAAAAS